MSASSAARPLTPRTSERTRATTLLITKRVDPRCISELLRRRREHRRHRFHQPLPARRVFPQPPPPRRRQTVELRPPVVLRFAPRALDQTVMLQPVQRRIQRTLLYLQRAMRDLLDPQQHAVTVHVAERDSLQNE